MILKGKITGNGVLLSDIGRITVQPLSDKVSLTVDGYNVSQTSDIVKVRNGSDADVITINGTGETRFFRKVTVSGTGAAIIVKSTTGDSNDLMQFLDAASGLLTRVNSSGFILTRSAIHLSGVVNVHQMNLAISGIPAVGSGSGVTIQQMNLAISGHTNSNDQHPLYIHAEPLAIGRNIITIDPGLIIPGIQINYPGGSTATDALFLVNDTDSSTEKFKITDQYTLLGHYIDMGGQNITNMADGSSMSHAATVKNSLTILSGHAILSGGVHGVSGHVVGTHNFMTEFNKTLYRPLLSGIVNVGSPDTSNYFLTLLPISGTVRTLTAIPYQQITGLGTAALRNMGVGASDLVDVLTLISTFAAIVHAHSATDITTGTLAWARGGTGASSYTKGDILYYDGSALSKLAIGSESQVLKVSAAGFPEWADP